MSVSVQARKQQLTWLAQCPARPPAFIAPMLLQKVDTLPKGPEWVYEIKWDGFRCVAIKDAGAARLWSRNRKILRFPSISEAVAGLPVNSAVVDGEIVCLDADGRPCFEDLQGSRGETGGLPIRSW